MEVKTKKTTHWFNWKEWKSTVDDAYNEENDPAAYSKALATIKAWEARDLNLPSALLCLKELLIGRISQINKMSSLDTYQSALAMNIVRFVNIITEPYQKNIYAKPVKNIAAEIGLPSWIVNLRHSATHFNLPSIEVLERALDDLFDWLKERYVDKYREIAIEKSLLNDIKLSIQNLFVDYMNTQYKATVMRHNKKQKQTEDLSEELLAKLENMTLQFRNETFEILVEDGYMIPTRDQLEAFGIVPEEFIEQENLYIPKSFLNIWTTFLAYCNDNKLIELLFQNLITAYKLETERTFTFNNDFLRKKFLLAWIVCLLKQNSFRSEKSKNSKFYFEFSFKQVLLDVLGSQPDHLGTYFLNEVCRMPSFSNEINATDLEKLRTLLEFVSMASTVEVNQSAPDTDNNQMDSDDQLEYDMSLFENKNSKDVLTAINANPARQIHSKSDWQLIDDSEWNLENLKIGIVDGQSYLNFNSDLNQLLHANKDENSLNVSSYNSEMNASLNAAANKPSQNLNSFSNFLNRNNIEFHKKTLMVNYWEFSS